MTEVTKEYLGNINQHLELARLVNLETCLEVTLQFSDRHKGRIHARTNSGVVVGIIKSRDRAVESGDLFRTNSGKLLLIHLPEQELLIIDLSALSTDVSPAKLVHLGHVLGNHHYPINIQGDRVYVQLVTDKTTIENLLGNLNIPGLNINYQRAENDRTIAFSSHKHE